MKKEYFKVYIRDDNYNRCLVVYCEVVCNISNSEKTDAYVFRDLISQKLILPNYGYTIKDKESTLTYNNYDKSNFHRISRSSVLKFLKGLNIEDLKLYQSYINDLENRIIEKGLTRIREYD